MVEPTVTPSPRSLGSHLAPLRRNWGWLLAAGIALAALGGIGLVATFFFSLVGTFAFGAMMLTGGVFLLADAFRHGGWTGRAWSGLIGLLYVVTGFLVFYNPLSALLTLTLLVAISLIIAGGFRVVMAFQLRPLSAWVFLLISGILSLLLGALIIWQWPQSSGWVIGTFLSVELIFQGWATIALARSIRSTFDGVTPRPDK